jgi:hypothetical protein
VYLTFSRDGGASGKLKVGPFPSAYLTGREPVAVLTVREGRLWRVQGQDGKFGTMQFKAAPQP